MTNITPMTTDKAGSQPGSKPSEDLAELAARINKEYEQLKESSRQIVLRAVSFGETLNDAKTKVGHGGFLKWVKENCKFSNKTAERYMKLAENKSRFMAMAQDKFEIVSNLTLNEAERLIDGGGGGGGSSKTPLDRFESAWGKVGLVPTQQAFVEANYQDLAKLMKEIDRKNKAA